MCTFFRDLLPYVYLWPRIQYSYCRSRLAILRYVVLLLLIIGVSYNGKVLVASFVKVAQKLERWHIQHGVLSDMHTFLLFQKYLLYVKDN